MVKILSSLRNFRDRIRTSISVKTTNILLFMAIFLIVILAILIRLSPIIRGITLIKAFDPWIQWYSAEYLNEHTLYEYFHWWDYKSWYPGGVFRGSLRPGLTFTVVILYKILNFIGLPISLYDVCFYFPAFMGGITVLVIYYLGKEVLNRGTGLIAAFFLAFNPGFLQRTTAGFFDNETIGVFATLATFLFFLKAARTGKFSYSVLGGVFLGYLSLSWGGYQFIFLLLPLISIILVLTNKYNENLLIAYAGVQGTGLLIFSLFISFNYGELFSSLELGGIFLFTIILIIFHIIYTKRSEYSSFYYYLINIIKWLIIPGILIFAIIIWVVPELLPFKFSSRFWTILNPLAREQVAHVASVAEQMPSSWSVFYYNTLIPLVLVPLGIYFCFKRLNVADIFLIAFIILMFYFTGSMIRIILIFAPASALVGAYGLVSILKIFGSFLGERKVGVSRMRRRQIKGTLGSSEVVAVYLVVGFLCVAQIVHATDIAVNQMSYAQMAPAGVLHEWEESLTWIRENLEGTDVVVSWWDYGYWLTPVGNVTTVNDNATFNRFRMGAVGMALMQTNEIYSLKVLQRLKADYILVYFGFLITGLGGDEGKWTWMIQICNDDYASYKQAGWEEDNWVENAVFDESAYRNMTHGYINDAWFDSQLVKLMFFGIPTDPNYENHNQFSENYAREISRRTDNDGDTWKSHIPDNGLYDTIAFFPEYFSKYGMVKLFKIDYTALDSRFTIKNAEVFDNGYATFKLDNHGEKDLQITSVEINDSSYDFVMGNVNNSLEKGSEDQVWVDMKSKGITFNEYDVVNITVTAQSEALYERVYTFTNKTSNFFVKKALSEEIKINRENSKVIQLNSSSADIYLEVENIGKSTVFLDRFYVNEDTIVNRFNSSDINYLDGSPILEPGEKANIHLKDVGTDFSLYPTIKYNKVGVATANNISDEVLFTSSLENYSIAIISSDRIISPEAAASIDNHYRKHIPVDFSRTHAYTYENGSTELNLYIKNTGDNQFGIESIYLNGVNPENEVDYEDYRKPVDLLLDVNEETVIVIDATDYVNGDINEEILICVTASFDTTAASDIGFIHTIKDEEDIQIIEKIEGTAVSYIYANETGRILIKNTGNGSITLENVIINNTLILNCSNNDEIEFLYGDSSLDIQECALISFDIPGFQINISNEVIVKVNTTTTAEYETTFKAIVDSEFYNITVDPSSKIDDSDNRVTIKIVNNGLWNVTLHSIYINNTYIPLSSFTFQVGNSFEINSLGGFITIYLNNLETFIGPISPGVKFIILARTIEGAEDTQEELVVA